MYIPGTMIRVYRLKPRPGGPHMAKGTPLIPIRFTADDKAKIDAIRDHYRLPSRAAAVREAVECLHAVVTKEAGLKARQRRRKKIVEKSAQGA